MIRPDAITAGATLIAAVAATFAGIVAVRTYRVSFKPVLRPVPARFPNGAINPRFLILKNIGRGPAVSVFLVEPPPGPGLAWPITNPGPIVTTVDVVEPLGQPLAGGGETSRIGRVRVDLLDDDPQLLRALRHDTTYRLLYQDLAGAWHETTFQFNDEHIFTTRYLGRRSWWATDEFPEEVKRQAQIVRESSV